MNALLVLLLIQAPVEENVGAFLKGDAAARQALLKAGTAAILPLQKARDQSPEKIDALVHELKVAAAHPKGSKAIESLAKKITLDLVGTPFRDALEQVRESCAVNLCIDRLEAKDLAAEAVSVAAAKEPARDVLTEICRQAGLDYGYFHNVIVVAKPERLWSDGKSKPAFGPAAAERQLKTPVDEKAIEQLKSMKVSLDFQGSYASDMGAYMKEISGMKFDFEAGGDKTVDIFRLKEISIFDALSLMTQLCDLDFMARDGTVVVNTREAIAKKK